MKASEAGPPGMGIPRNVQYLKLPTGIPRSFEDFSKLSLFLDSDISVLCKTSLFHIMFWQRALNTTVSSCAAF